MIKAFENLEVWFVTGAQKTSVLQTPILLIGSLVILYLGLKELGGWNVMMETCAAQGINDYGDSMTTLMRSCADKAFPWYGTLFGSAIIVSLFTKKPAEEQITGLVFGTATPEQKAIIRASWNKWDIFHTVIILGVTVAFYIYFW